MSYGPYHVIRYPKFWEVQDQSEPVKGSLGKTVSKHRSGDAAHRKARKLAKLKAKEQS